MLLLGATGAMGRRAAAELARSDEVSFLLMAARNRGSLEGLARYFGGDGRIASAVLDARDEAALADAMAAMDVSVSCAGPGYLLELPSVRAAVRAGTPYVSLCNDLPALEAVLELAEEARGAGVTVVTGCGLSPGLTNLLVRLAAESLDRVVEIDVAAAMSSTEADGAAAAQHLLRMLGEDARFYSGGRTANAPTADAPRPVYFPEPVGWVETYLFGHPEVATLGRTFPELQGARFRLGLTERAVMDAARGAGAIGLTRTEDRRRLALKLTRPFTPLLQRLPPRGPTWSAARVDVHGETGGRPSTLSLGVADHLSNLAATTIARAALDIGAGRVTAPGVHPPDAVFDPRSFLREVAARGVRPARLEPYPV
ncbi:MAG: saccharopine dehydrogenase family protein [Actinomycetota bacterium]